MLSLLLHLVFPSPNINSEYHRREPKINAEQIIITDGKEKKKEATAVSPRLPIMVRAEAQWTGSTDRHQGEEGS